MLPAENKLDGSESAMSDRQAVPLRMSLPWRMSTPMCEFRLKAYHPTARCIFYTINLFDPIACMLTTSRKKTRLSQDGLLLGGIYPPVFALGSTVELLLLLERSLGSITCSA